MFKRAWGFLFCDFYNALSLRGYAEAIQNNKILKSKITELNPITFYKYKP